MPVIADQVLNVGAEKIGWLMGASGLGAITGVLIAAPLARTPHRGPLIIVGAVLFGLFLIAFAITSSMELYGLSMVVLFLSGIFNSIYLMLVMTTLVTQVPDQLRGRVMGIYAIAWSMAPLGGLQANTIAHYLGAPVAIAIGGGLVAAFALGPALVYRRMGMKGALALR